MRVPRCRPTVYARRFVQFVGESVLQVLFAAVPVLPLSVRECQGVLGSVRECQGVSGSVREC